MKIDGACHCQQVSYQAEVDPERVLICHCSDCQTLSGSAYRTVVPAQTGTFKLLSGTLKTYVKTAQDGTRRTQVFCPQCGTPIYAGPVDGDSGMLGLRVGSIKQRDRLSPKKQYWCDSARDWVQDLSSITRVESE